MQISKKFEQNVIFCAIILWQEDLKADKMSMPSWSLLTMVTLSFFKRSDFLPDKAGFNTPQRHNSTLRKLEICFLPQDALATFCLGEPSSPPWCYQPPLSLLLPLMGSVLYFLHCQSAPLARVRAGIEFRVQLCLLTLGLPIRSQDCAHASNLLWSRRAALKQKYRLSSCTT